VALWDRSLKATEVAALYAVGTAAPGTRKSPFTTTAKVDVGDNAGPIALKPEEKIAIMFLTAIQMIESDCQNRAQRACTFDQLLAGPVAGDGAHIDRLKFDPRLDPNYTYVVSVHGTAWEAHANAKKPGLIGFYYWGRTFPQATATYNRTGVAGVIDEELNSRSVDGDSFAGH
jgi:hypothetical protein